MMWQNKAKTEPKKPDPPMKLLARQLLTNDVEEPAVKVRAANLALRFGEPDMPDTVQEDLDNLLPTAEKATSRTRRAQKAQAKEHKAFRKASLKLESRTAPAAAKERVELTRESQDEISSIQDAATGRAVDKGSLTDTASESSGERAHSVDAAIETAKDREEVAAKDRRQKTSPQVRQAKLLARMGVSNRPIKEAELKIRSPKFRSDHKVRRRPRRFATFAELVAYAQDQFPNPRDMQLQQKPEYQTWLLARLAHCYNSEDLERLAFSLDYKELAMIFPALASIKSGDAIDKLLRIIVLRASKYLYIQGWLTLQYAYPCSNVQKGLAVLCEVLEEAINAGKASVNKPAGQSGQHNHLALNLEEMSHLDGLDLGLEHFDWKSVHLISEISLPNTRHFMSSIIKFIRDSAISGSDFYKRYGIYRDLALGQAVNNQWEMAVFESNLYDGEQLPSLFSET